MNALRMAFAASRPATTYAGMMRILRFNWPFFAAGASAVALILALTIAVPMPAWLRIGLWGGAGLAAFWMTSTLAVSHYVYDRSAVCRWDWVPAALGFEPWLWMNLHAGLDESTEALSRLFPGSYRRLFDLFDPVEMPERSIRRARRLYPAQDAEPADLKHLPVDTAAMDAAFLTFAAHEIRNPDSRLLLFRELHRVVRPGGAVLVVEHTRDVWTFAAFGPGFLHFLPRREWRRLAKESGFELSIDRRMTPFVRLFVLRRMP